jgi:RecT family protein
MPEIQPLKFSEEQKRVWKANFAPNATPDQWALFIDECERRALIPNTHVVFSLRSASEQDPITREWIKIKKVAFITTINALRLLVDRYSDAHPDRAFKGYGKFTYYYGTEGDDLIETAIPRAGIPHAVSVTVKRKDWDEPLFVSARYDASVQTNSKGEPTAMWIKRGPEQLAKCCEAFALRAIAPEELGGLYLKEELEATLDQPEDTPTPAPTTPAPVPQATVAPAVNQAPAKEEPAIKPATTPSGLPKAIIPPAPMFQATDDDLPAGLFDTKPVTPAQPAPDARPNFGTVPYSQPPQPAETPTEAPKPVVAQPAPVPPAPAAPAPAAPTGNKAATAAERNSLNGRIARIVRDVLPKGGIPEKQAGDLMKAYFVRAGGGPYTSLPFSRLQELLVALETAGTPETVAAIVKGALTT